MGSVFVDILSYKLEVLISESAKNLLCFRKKIDMFRCKNPLETYILFNFTTSKFVHVDVHSSYTHTAFSAIYYAFHLSILIIL
jgi:hypothetical protein